MVIYTDDITCSERVKWSGAKSELYDRKQKAGHRTSTTLIVEGVSSSLYNGCSIAIAADVPALLPGAHGPT